MMELISQYLKVFGWFFVSAVWVYVVFRMIGRALLHTYEEFKNTKGENDGKEK